VGLRAGRVFRPYAVHFLQFQVSIALLQKLLHQLISPDFLKEIPK
jgi:hypothetical protein